MMSSYRLHGEKDALSMLEDFRSSVTIMDELWEEGYGHFVSFEEDGKVRIVRSI